MVDDTQTGTHGWQRFWNRGTWWKAFLAAVGYLAIYEGFSRLIGLIWGSRVTSNPLTDPASVFFALLLPIAVGAIVLSGFVASLKWFPALFARQPIPGRWWMWIPAAVAVIPIALRLAGINYRSFSAGVLALTFLSGLMIGFTEELLTRGIAVKLLRDAGHHEIVVAVVSSAVFAVLHSVNLLAGQPVLTVLLTMVFAFGFGMIMYLVLRVTRNLIWPMLLHALTDPTTFLATGGIDTGTGAAMNTLLTLAGPFNIVFVVVGALSIILIRGHVSPNNRRAA